METAVYYYKQNEYSDIYHSVQSLRIHHKNLGKIYILTDDDIPFEDEQIIKVPLPNEGEHKEQILITKLKKFCEMELCDEFIHMSADFFVNKPFDSTDLLPPMSFGDIRDKAKPYQGMPEWNHLLYNTMLVLEEHGYTTFNHATHTPSYVNCKRFLDMTDILPSDCNWQWQTCYNNMWHDSRRFLVDNKEYAKVLMREQRKIYTQLSTNDCMFFTATVFCWNDDFREFIRERFGG